MDQSFLNLSTFSSQFKIFNLTTNRFSLNNNHLLLYLTLKRLVLRSISNSLLFFEFIQLINSHLYSFMINPIILITLITPYTSFLIVAIQI